MWARMCIRVQISELVWGESRIGAPLFDMWCHWCHLLMRFLPDCSYIRINRIPLINWLFLISFQIPLFSCLLTRMCFLLFQDDSRISVQLITEECVHKLDTKHQTNALLNLVWRDSASEEVFTMMASICHTLMVQHRLMVPKVRYKYTQTWWKVLILEEPERIFLYYCFIV